MKEKIERIKSVIKAKDKRFWLMIFVVISTLLVFVVWTLDFKNIFSVEKEPITDEQFDFAKMKDDVQTDMNKTLNEFSVLIDKKMEESRVDDSVQAASFKKVEEAINDKIEEQKNASSTAEQNVEKSDLEKSDETVENLKKRIEELEKKLEE
ncbi:MAG TPA: hypothetical protein PK686_01890 [bacterium]|nr:hypothetical protein [bacterium]HPV65419.1 hypothetical protein [bacterium]